MTTNATAQVNNATPTLRDWHKDADIQAFIKALNDGQLANDDVEQKSMDSGLAETVLAHIDTKSKFIEMAKEYAPEHELEDGYDVYTVEGETLYSENNEALLQFANPEWVKTNSDQVESLYDSIAYYGIGNISHEDINNAFFEGDRDTDEEQDAWHMGCRAINNKALHCLLITYAVFTGITEVKQPTGTMQRIKHRFLLNPDSSNSVEVDLISDKLSNEEKLMDTDVVIGGQVLFVMEGTRMEEFRDEFRALANKYRI